MGMAATPQQVTTLEEFFALPEDNSHRHELLDGVYIVSPPPSYRHQLAVMELFRRLQPAVASRPDLLLFPVLGDIVLGPRSVAGGGTLAARRQPAGDSPRDPDLGGARLKHAVRSRPHRVLCRGTR